MGEGVQVRETNGGHDIEDSSSALMLYIVVLFLNFPVFPDKLQPRGQVQFITFSLYTFQLVVSKFYPIVELADVPVAKDQVQIIDHWTDILILICLRLWFDRQDFIEA